MTDDPTPAYKSKPWCGLQAGWDVRRTRVQLLGQDGQNVPLEGENTMTVTVEPGSENGTKPGEPASDDGRVAATEKELARELAERPINCLGG
jgi:hypothetical protein